MARRKVYSVRDHNAPLGFYKHQDRDDYILVWNIGIHEGRRWVDYVGALTEVTGDLANADDFGTPLYKRYKIVGDQSADLSGLYRHVRAVNVPFGWRAFFKHGAGDIVRTVFPDVQVILTSWPFKGHPYSGRDQSGYGAQIPMDFGAVTGGIRRRVYMICFANSGSCYIKVKGLRYFVDSLDLEAVRRGDLAVTLRHMAHDTN
jgi:hypothetical protein